jgi:glucose dehydrogenase
MQRPASRRTRDTDELLAEASRRQFVIAVAGGHGSLGTKAGDAIIAYALPKP